MVRRLGILLVVLVAAGVAVGATLEIKRKAYVAIDSLTAQAAYNGGIWTGWIDTQGHSTVCFEVENDYTGNTGITFRCESSDATTTTADEGFDITMDDLASGAATSTLITWAHSSGAADVRYTKCVDYIPHDFINCLFDDEAGNDATDDLTVRYSLQTP